MISRRKLTERQRRFVEAYHTTGNAVESARQAGYKSPHPEGVRLLRNATVAAAITAQGEKRTVAAIADRKERQTFWSKVARDEVVDMNHRLKASELLGKAKGDFLSKVEVSGAGGGPVQHLGAQITLTAAELEEAVLRAIGKV